ncbi:DUF4432 family protein [Leucobacter sp. CSA1]|uniref:DUF4432 family protein n=1 Tax=Leucobacter chromiisoli TaxID=2796471 RepID=A0A934Q612_9MICO|nr:DUF4432 family protein [Leucobacter chromiisoli]MBK0417522.1 DUF4432 family protein [Leucobacter chromiisoli]
MSEQDPLADTAAEAGALGLISSCESSVVSDGPEAGTRRIRLVSGDLDVELLPDRGLDLGVARVAGVPVSWVSPTGFPRRDLTADTGFARTFGGGLLATCGLQNFGPEQLEDGGGGAGSRVAHPMHGRYGSIPASVVRAEADETGAVVEGRVREAEVFGVDLELRRRVELPLGERAIRIRDVVVNRGALPAECMVLYHLNFGWPLVAEGTELRTGAEEVLPRDAAAEAGLEEWHRFPALSERYPEQVFSHRLPGGRSAEIGIAHPGGFTARVAYDPAQLPGLFQWRVAERGFAVLAVEPATAPTILGRADALARGLTRTLPPGGRFELGLEISFTGAPSLR